MPGNVEDEDEVQFLFKWAAYLLQREELMQSISKS